MKQKGWSINGLARHLGVSSSVITRWRDGTAFPSKEILPSLAKALGTSEARLATWAKPRHASVTNIGKQAYDPKLPMIGRNHRAAREAVGWTQKRLMAETGLSQTDISRIECGRSITSEKLYRSQSAIKREFVCKAERDKRNQAQRERRALRRQQDRAGGVSSTV